MGEWARSTWEVLPANGFHRFRDLLPSLRRQIINEALQDARRSGGRLASFAILDREWQEQIEVMTFRPLGLASNDLVAFEKICKGRRTLLVEAIFLTIDLTTLGNYFAPIHVDNLLASDNPWVQNSRRHRRSRILANIANAFARLFNILETWDRNGRDDCSLVDLGWKIIKSHKLNPTKEDKLMNRSASLRCDFTGLPKVSVVGSLSAYEDTCSFRLNPSSAVSLMKKTPNVHTTHITFGPNIISEYASGQTDEQDAVRSLPDALKSLSLGSGNYCRRSSSNWYRKGDDDYTLLTRSIADLGIYLHNLESLKLHRVAHVGLFFERHTPGVEIRWPKLRELEVVGCQNTWIPRVNDNLFMDMAQALYGMPNIRYMDVSIYEPSDLLETLTKSFRVRFSFQPAPKTSRWPAWMEVALLYIRDYVPPPAFVEIWKATVWSQWEVPVLGYTYTRRSMGFVPWKDPFMGWVADAGPDAAEAGMLAAQAAELDYWRAQAEIRKTRAVDTNVWRDWYEVADVQGYAVTPRTSSTRFVRTGPQPFDDRLPWNRAGRW